MMKSLEELENQLNKQISEFDERRKSTRKFRNFLQISQVLLTAISTFFVAISIKYGGDLLSIAALFFGILATVMSVFQSSFEFHGRLHSFTQTSAKLQSIRAELKFNQFKNDDYPNEFPISMTLVDQLFYKMQSTLEGSNEQWSQMMKDNKPKAQVNDMFKNPNSR